MSPEAGGGDRSVRVGFYGKLPSHGDFLQRRVTEAFVSAWDGWLQAGLAASRQVLGERWLEVYLTSPTWRFACAAGACGPDPLVGVMAPSVDRVGRYFPLVIVASPPAARTPLDALGGSWRFFESAERLLVETLAADVVDFGHFDEAVAALGAEFVPGDAGGAAGERVALFAGGAGSCWHVAIPSAREVSAGYERLAAEHLAAIYAPLVIWCTDGSALVRPSSLVTQGLPHPDLFAGLLDGSWVEHHWQPARQEGVAPADPLALIPDAGAAALRFESAGLTHPGLVRSVNQDAFLDRPDTGVWVVADGLGGLRDGEVASRMVCDALADFVPVETFERAIDEARTRLARVNDYLVRAASRPEQAVHSGSTVVALLARGPRCAVLWAGDSRAYRWRDGRLDQLTRDHALDALEVMAGAEAHAVTRAIGGEATLVLDLHDECVRPGDRFLLCSDGLTRTVAAPVIARCLAYDDLRTAVNGLVEEALRAGAPDNVTALVVEARAD